MYSIFKNHSDKFEIYCYSTNPTEDNITNKIKKYTIFKNISNITSDKEAAELIRDDNIDILIDQMVFNYKTRINILRYKPAKYIINYLSSSISSLYSEIDYVIADKYLYYISNKKLYREKPLLLKNGIHLFDQELEIFSIDNKKVKIDIFKNKIMLGITCSLFKINKKFIKLLKNILDKIPNSILLIRNREYKYEILKDNFLEKLKNEGIDLSRINIDFISKRIDFYKFYKNIDILLDTYPYGGCTTIFECLIMSTPVVTLIGKKWCSRYGFSFLHHLKLEELIAYNIQEYVNIVYNLFPS